MIKIGLDSQYCVDFDNKPYLDKHLTVTLSDFSFFNNKKAIGDLEESFSDYLDKNKNKSEIEVCKNRNSFLDNISFNRMAERPFAPETDELLGSDIVTVSSVTGAPEISVLTKLTLSGRTGLKYERTKLTIEGFEKRGISSPISEDQMIAYSENIKSWLANGGSPGKEITEDDLYNIAIDGKLDDLTTISAENLALKSLAEQSTKCYEAMSKIIDEIFEDDKKVNYAG